MIINKNYTLLQLGLCISFIGDNISSIAMTLYLYNLQKDVTLIGLFVSFLLIPHLLGYTIAGVISDNYNKKKILIICDSLRALLIFSLFYITHVIYYFIIAFLIQFLSVFFNNAKDSLIPDIVPKEKLLKANSFNSIFSNIVKVIGPVIGSFTIGLFDIQTAYIIDSISYILSLILIFSMDVNQEKINKCINWNNILFSYVSTYKIIKKNTKIKNILFLYALTTFFTSPFEAVLIPLAKDILLLNDANLGITTSLLALGTITSSLFIYKISNDKMFTAILFSIFATGIIFLTMGLLNIYFFMFFLLFMLGVFGSIYRIFFFSWLQILTPNEHIGSVLSFFMFITMLLMVISIPLGTFTMKLTSIKYVFTIMGISLIIETIYIINFKKVMKIDLEQI